MTGYLCSNQQSLEILSNLTNHAERIFCKCSIQNLGEGLTFNYILFYVSKSHEIEVWSNCPYFWSICRTFESEKIEISRQFRHLKKDIAQKMTILGGGYTVLNIFCSIRPNYAKSKYDANEHMVDWFVEISSHKTRNF